MTRLSVLLILYIGSFFPPFFNNKTLLMALTVWGKAKFLGKRLGAGAGSLLNQKIWVLLAGWSRLVLA